MGIVGSEVGVENGSGFVKERSRREREGSGGFQTGEVEFQG